MDTTGAEASVLDHFPAARILTSLIVPLTKASLVFGTLTAPKIAVVLCEMGVFSWHIT